MFEKKNFLVVGGSRGIGKAVVLKLYEMGAKVIFTYISDEVSANELEKESENIQKLKVDSTNYEKVMQTTKEIFSETTLDGLVICAGITDDKSLTMMKKESWDKVIDVNLNGTFNYLKSVSYNFVKQGHGSIVCISSLNGITGSKGQSNYAASKAGQIALIKSFSKEIAKFNVRANIIAPGYIDTDMFRKLSMKEIEEVENLIPMQRVGKPKEVANLVSFLLSEEASYITGSTIEINGGL
ncbi:3-oxoacyl-[acyl-carrier protein] reductase [Staphylococcus epidermidis]|uniref:SDR family oxidoreductase n=1 Tax=Staphylococcus epidermidis TaxID=1282 RepID=UPI0019314C45|nr:SDR family oxidoreductase [Staphylococcus epidermidis]